MLHLLCLPNKYKCVNAGSNYKLYKATDSQNIYKIYSLLNVNMKFLNPTFLSIEFFLYIFKVIEIN